MSNVGLRASYSMTSLPMPSQDTKEDPRMVELTAVNHRLKTVISFLKSKHTTESLNYAIEEANEGLGDHTASFVPLDNTVIRGTRHLGSLLCLSEVLEIKAEIGHIDHVFDECTALLERKVALLKDIYKV